MLRPKHEEKAEDWVRSHLSSRYGVSHSKIKLADKLKDWGFVDESDLAELTAVYNRSTHTDPDWKGGDVTPPELIKAVRGKTVGHLASFIASNTAPVAQEAAVPPPVGKITDFLVRELQKGGHDDIDKKSNVPEFLFGNAAKQNEIEAHFHDQIQTSGLATSSAHALARPQSHTR